MSPFGIVFDGALWLAIPIALLAGLVSFLSPCVLPLVPGYLGFLGGAAPERAGARAGGRSRLLWGVLLFIAGFTAVFVAIFVLGGTLGQLFIRFQDPITRVLGVVVILLGLVFIGLFGVAQRTVRLRTRDNLGLVGAPLLGVAMGIGWAPCIGPTMTAILAISINQGDPVRAGILGVAYSLGLGVPFILLAVGFGWATRSVTFVKRHIRAINITGGVLLIALGLLMVTGVWTDLLSRLGAVIGSVQLPL
ncbi:cytochrome c biogenesis protein CcdA [Microbacterium sp. zg.Y1090]|uniref:cytochrome c biogenesis CcdA family protein n=1 Tax=Microbacterium TaxID=33882 RepID=UPI00214C7BF7|nr:MULTISPECIES: cytochrome c biogenesis protein CcdA [unclassified Microbacterium]MCR2812536.1 cytochrome c biogenesis protein CcdA [Microbacterium sp. zg.Y1084]MCR2817663.1 cytochrome c biogenesis protein CcdA [Microbacterium sp. zg.Y1090]MDL5485694.1 cytochrome c biogenesis protein CcdA [Microbacterium sp. zg-Y1211]WIM28863.1 cytochrome c biogenesis protein CcdA [Microbacterium sp. zg-Y1090]